MAHRAFRPGAAAIRAKRETLWFTFTGLISTLTSGGGTILHALNAAALAFRPFTIVRSRFELLIRSDQDAASEDQAVNFGIEVVSAPAVAIGVTAVPTPVAEQGSDFWLAHQIMFNSFGRTASGLGQRGTRYVVDSRAMRKVEDGMDVITVAELDTGVSAGGAVILVSGRMLIKTH